jgi:hypothetical protein
VSDDLLRHSLQNIWDIVCVLPVRQRKRLVLLCRAQEVVIDDPFNLLAIQTGFGHLPDQYESDQDQKQLFLLVTRYRHMIKSPILSSIILDICRSAPLSVQAVKEQKLASWGKEIAVCERSERALHFDYSCWFDESCRNRPLVAGTPANPSMAYRIARALSEWRQNISGRILYPRMSRKMVSLATKRNWESHFGREWVTNESEGGIEMTQETLEQAYHEHGVEIPGPCEIRQKWYKSGVVPRTYFAQGGTAYSKSKYIQEVAGTLTESLLTTHPISRLNPARIKLRGDSHYLRIYDLTTFTSNHWECKHFVEQLGQWCLGTTIRVVDGAEGLLHLDLGELILEYNAHMNFFPEYSLERIDEEFSEVLEYHNQAGFLGVYGNINFSTFLHGASILMVVQSEDEANIAGDDGHYSQEHGMEWIADRIIDANGLLEPTKTFRSDQIGAVCLKRGLIQIDQRCLPKIMLVFPSFSNIGELFHYSPPQFASTRQTKTEIRSKIGAELYRFYRALFTAGINNDLEQVHDLLRAIYTVASFPKHGSLPPWSETLIPVLPDTADALLSIHPLDFLLRNHFSNGAILPKIIEPHERNAYPDPIYYSGGEWEGPSTKKLRYLGVLGYVVKEEITEALWGVAAYERLVDVFSGKAIKLYSWTCIRDVPDFLASVPIN